ncbi:hypothetical protein [Pedobacter sp. MW01-1-1]|uniref:hypothetical protein n=1 Tax=Pedobacter sp. MW01-1-1 TaxID=3383027 RepID=UPI003FEE5FE6
MKNWYKTFRTKYYYDNFPKRTKILTFTLMPIICILFIGISLYLNWLSNRTAENYEFISGKIVQVVEQKRKTSNQTTDNLFNIKIDQTNLFLNKNHLSDTSNISLIKTGKIAKIYFEKKDNSITQMYVGNQKIIGINDYNSHIKSSRNVTIVIAVLFTLWLISRIYRYRKYKSLN